MEVKQKVERKNMRPQRSAGNGTPWSGAPGQSPVADAATPGDIALGPALSQQVRELTGEWKRSWSEALSGRSLVNDMIAAITVAAVALPLNIALAIACGLPASAGLIAGAVGGALAAIFGGAALQVTGPAAALNVMVLGIMQDFGATGVAATCLIVAVVQLALCAVAAGRYVRFMPEAVLAGFTTGVGLKLLDNQLPDLLGFNYSVAELAQMMHRPEWLHEVSWLAVVSGMFVALMVTTCKQFKRFPAALVALALVTAVSVHLSWGIERVGALPPISPWPRFPAVADHQWINLLALAVPLALLASIESLISAQAVDRLAKPKRPHHSNLELFGQSMANLGSGLFGGMPVSGVIVRSSVNVQSGGKTRIAALLHAALLLVSILYLGETLAAIPLSALAGLLCVVAMRLIEVKTLLHLMSKARLEAVAFLTVALGTLSGHLLMGLVAGTLISVLGKWLRHEPPAEPSHTEGSGQAVTAANRRAIIAASTIAPRRPYVPAAGEVNWLEQIRERAQLAKSAFIHHRASVIGRVVLGEHVLIAAESSVRADEGSPFFIGSNSNIQDGVVIHALKERWVNVGGEDWAVYIGENVSVAHQALVHGPCYIGDNCFVGFQAVVHDSVVGAHCYIGIGAIVVGVEIPERRYVAHGMVVDSVEAVERLPFATDAHLNFNKDVVGVNRGLAAAYRENDLL